MSTKKLIGLLALGILLGLLLSLARAEPITNHTEDATEYGVCMVANALCASISLGGTNEVIDVVDQMKANGTLQDHIKRLAKAGEICKVFGHQWRGGRPGEGGMHLFADYHPGISYRTCAICGKCESQTREWK